MQQQLHPIQAVPPAILRRAEAEGFDYWLCGYRLSQKTWGCLYFLIPWLLIGAFGFGILHSPVGLIIVGLERSFVAAHLPRFLERYERGETLDFHHGAHGYSLASDLQRASGQNKRQWAGRCITGAMSRP